MKRKIREVCNKGNLCGAGAVVLLFLSPGAAEAGNYVMALCMVAVMMVLARVSVCVEIRSKSRK